MENEIERIVKAIGNPFQAVNVGLYKNEEPIIIELKDLIKEFLSEETLIEKAIYHYQKKHYQEKKEKFINNYYGACPDC